MPTPLLKAPDRLEIERIVEDALGVGGTWQVLDFRGNAIRNARMCWPEDMRHTFCCTPSRGTALFLEDAGEGWWGFAIRAQQGSYRTGQIHVSSLAAWLRVQFRTMPEKVSA